MITDCSSDEEVNSILRGFIGGKHNGVSFTEPGAEFAVGLVAECDYSAGIVTVTENSIESVRGWSGWTTSNNIKVPVEEYHVFRTGRGSMAALEKDLAETRGALSETDKLLASMRMNVAAKDNMIKLLEVEKNVLATDSAADQIKISLLDSECARLKKQIGEKSKEIASLREDAIHAVRNHQTPSAPVRCDLSMSALGRCAEEIMNFNMTRLRSRAQRDSWLSNHPGVLKEHK